MDISERVDLLFRTILDEDGQEYSYRQIEKLAGGEVSATSIWKLRIGKTKNPGQKMIRALSKAFRVPVNYFFDEVVSRENVPQYRDEYRDSEKIVGQIALRAGQLNGEGQEAILNLIAYIQKTHET
jgi:transcriptional regulator with XRE-family HTH domain